MIGKFLIFLFVILTFNCKSQSISKWWYKIDGDTRHVYTGVAATTISGALTYKLTKGKTGWSVFTGFMTGVAAGVGEEFVWESMIKKKPLDTWSMVDMFWGAAIGSVCLRVGIDLHEKKQLAREEEYQKRFQNLNILEHNQKYNQLFDSLQYNQKPDSLKK